MILLNKVFLIILVIFVSSCSLDKKTGIWTKTKKIAKEKNVITKELFEDAPKISDEINPNLKINLNSKLVSNSFVDNFNNNNGRIKFDGNLQKKSRFRFSKIDNFKDFEPEIVFSKKNIIFFDNKGSIFKFDDSSRLLWKKNHYTKKERKLKPILSLGSNNDTLIVSDNIAKVYAVKIDTGELIWTKTSSAPFNSQIKVYNNKLYVVDFNNTLKCFSIDDGSLIFEFKTENSFIKSQKKLSLILIDNIVYFNNSIGDITAVNMETGDLIWQTPTRSSLELGDSFFLKTSDIIGSKDTLLFSNNKNQFFSIDTKTGILNWEQKINSDLRPTLINNLIFTVTNEGYFIILDNVSGKIKRATDLFYKYKPKLRKKIKPVGFIVGSKNIYLSTNNGRLIIADIISGKVLSILKIDNTIISRPFVLNQDIFVIKENAIIRLN